jgi:hypothetical protein
MEMEWDEKELVEIDLVRLEEAYHKQELQYVPLEQLRKVHKVFLNSTTWVTSRFGSGLGIHSDVHKDQCKLAKEGGKRGRKSTQNLIQEIGSYMVNSGQI